MGKKRGPIVEYINRSKKRPVVKRPVVEKKADKLIIALKEAIFQVDLALTMLKNKYKL